MAIQIADGFQLRVAKPLDDRQNVETIAQLDPTYGYEGQIVYVKDIKQFYTCYKDENGSLAYKVMENGGGAGGDLDLTDYQKKTDNTLTTTDKTVTGAINEVNGNLLDTVGFSADYKNIILNRKSGLNPYTIPITAIINNASLAELKDIDSTDVGNGKILVYDSATNKHKYVDSSITDEFVKMDSTTDANYLSNLIDKSTVVNDNGVLKVKKLDGQEVTITEINYLKGLTMNVMDLVSAFANGGVKVLNTPLNTASELDTMDRTSFIEGISYIVYVLADETHAGAKTTYLVDKTNTTFFGNADSQRNFTTNPIDLANEVTGKLDNSHIDVDSLWSLLTINDTYKTLTTNNEIFGTHGAKAMYDELTTAIGEKANITDLTTHNDNTDIHVTSVDKAKWDKVTDKVDTTDFRSFLGRYIFESGTDLRLLYIGKIYSIGNQQGFTSIEVRGGRVDGNLGHGYIHINLNGHVVANLEHPISNITFFVTKAGNEARLYCNMDTYCTLVVDVANGSKCEVIGEFVDSSLGTISWNNAWRELATMDKLGDNDTRVTTLETQVSELFQSVSDGKTLVANAITDKGVSTSTTATFATMATNISKINTNGYKEETVSYDKTSTGTNRIVVTFSDDVYGVKQITPPSDSSSNIVPETLTNMFTINGKKLILYVNGVGTWKVTALIKQ